MNDLLNAKFVEVIRPSTIVDNASFTTTEIDTLGFGYATFVFSFGTADIAMVALKLQESDTSGSGMADIPGTIVGTSASIQGTSTTLPSATDDGKIWILQADLRGRKRYLDLLATAGDGSAGTYASCVCILTKAQQAPVEVADMASGSVLRG